MRPGRPHHAFVAVLAALALGVGVASAGDDSGPGHASANLVDPVGDNGQSFGQSPTDVVRIAVAWSVDTLTLSLTYKETPPSSKFAMVVTDRADNDLQETDNCAPNDADSLRITGTASGTATLTQAFINGNLKADASVVGNTTSYAFSHPTLTAYIRRGNDPFTCVSGNVDGDHFFGAFQGKALRLTSANATAGLRQALEAHFKAVFTNATRKWLTCPRQELIPASGNSSAVAACEFEFGRSGGIYHGGSTSMYLADGHVDTIDYLNKVTTVYTKRLQRCQIASTRSGWVNGVVLKGRTLANSGSLGEGRRCAFLVGPAGMASDIESDVALHPTRHLTTYLVGLHGTNQAGFEERSVFRCRVTEAGQLRRFDCLNGLGDRFVYGFTLGRR